jgi:hypothetical protein
MADEYWKLSPLALHSSYRIGCNLGAPFDKARA